MNTEKEKAIFKEPFKIIDYICNSCSFYSFVMNQYPLVATALAFVLGVLLGGKTGPWHEGWLAAVWGGVFCAAIALLWRKKGNATVQSVVILAMWMAIGALRQAVEQRKDASLSQALPSQKMQFDAVVTKGAEVRGSNVTVDLELVQAENLGNRQVRVWMERDTDGQAEKLRAGDGIWLYTKFKRPVNRKNSGMDYARWLRSQGIVLTAWVGKNSWGFKDVNIESLSYFKRALIKMRMRRQRLVDKLQSTGIDQDALAVTVAMALGDRSKLDKRQQRAYADVGVAHLLALSGLHLGVIYAFLSLILGGRWSGIAGECVKQIALWLYVMLVGMTPSVTRAALMVTISSVGRSSENEVFSLNSLSVAAIIMLLASPYMLYDIGFQLSYVAVASISIFMRNSFKRRIASNRRWLSAGARAIGVCIAAQLGTLPLTIYYFGTFAPWFLITNILMIPLATLLLYMCGLLFLLFAMSSIFHQPFWQQAQSLLVNGIEGIVAVQQGVLGWAATLPHSTVSGIRLTGYQIIAVVLMALCIGAIYARIRKRM